jgi:hypothetical protein
MARLLPIIPSKSLDKKPKTLGDIRGWLNDDDLFFKHLDMIREENRREKSIDPFRRKKLKK